MRADEVNSTVAHEADLYFEKGGPIQRYSKRLVERMGFELTVRVRCVGFLMLTWVPLLILALIEGRALGPSPKESLLLDIATYVRFFLAVPLLILAESVVGLGFARPVCSSCTAVWSGPKISRRSIRRSRTRRSSASQCGRT
jgi:hypothetical protein